MEPAKRAILMCIRDGQSAISALARAAAVAPQDAQRLLRALAREGLIAGGGTIPLRLTEAGRRALG